MIPYSLTGEIYFPNWRSGKEVSSSCVCSLLLLCVLLCGREGKEPWGEKGATPPRRRSRLPMSLRAAPLEVFFNVVIWSIHDASKISVAIIWLIVLYDIYNKTSM